MTTERDTICAISTPPGIGGIAVARVSGPDAFEITDTIWKGKKLTEAKSHTAHLGTIVTPATGEALDQAVATVFHAPHSFTADNVVEIAVHGSRFVQRELLRLLTEAGCRLAEPGEFTRRAFTAGKMDLAEAEAVADVIASNSRAAHRLAISQMRGSYSRKLTQLREKLTELASLLELELDFSEEDVEFASRNHLRNIASEIHAEVMRLHNSFATGTAIKDGIPVVIAGKTNAGKSSLLNALTGDDRAIVSDIHGTTRDTIEETLELGDYLFRFIDTAGLRQTTDTIEAIGIERSLQAIKRARIIILVTEASDPLAETEQQARQIAGLHSDTPIPPHIITVSNKTDLATHPYTGNLIPISAKTGKGLDRLKQALIEAAQADNGTADEGLLVTNARHAAALAAAAAAANRVIEGLDLQLSGDLIALDLRETIHHLASITGNITSADILATIFSRFCIGK